MLNSGDYIEFFTPDPFVVKSQDDMHPFMLFIVMSGAEWSEMNPACTGLTQTPCGQTADCYWRTASTPDACVPSGGRGDPDFVLDVPTGQYSRNYVFFADPTYPFTVLTVLIDPVQFGGSAFEPGSDDVAAARLTVFVCGWIATAIYGVVVWSMYKSMVKNFDMTIRRQSR